MNREMKVCLECARSMTKPKRYSYKQWDGKIFCSNKCAAKKRKSTFKTGQAPWNKDTKGVMKPNKTSWKKRDKRLVGKKQTKIHIINAVKARGFNFIPMSKEEKSSYRYFYSLKKNFGMDKKDYLELLNMQGNVCAICGKDEEDNGRRLCVDHCHDSGVVRGILCTDCNTALGLMKDSVEVLKKMKEYLND